MHLSNFEYLHPFRRYSPPNFKIIRNLAKFYMFLAIKIFWGWALKILDRHYEIRPRTDHHAKFHADRQTHLGDLALEEKTRVRSASYRFQAD